MEAITSLRKSLYIKHTCSVSASLQAHTVQVTKLHVFHCWVHPLKSGWEQALIWWWQIAERSTERGRDKESPGGKQMYCRCRRAKSTAFILRLCWEKCHLIIRVERPFSATRETRYSTYFYKMCGSFSMRAFQEQGWFLSLIYPRHFLMNFGGGFFGILILLLQKYITDFLLILCYFKKNTKYAFSKIELNKQIKRAINESHK